LSLMAEERTADLIELARAVSGARVEGAENVQVCGMEFDSRRAMAGNLFVAVPGFEVDGHEYARAAVDAGAAALVLEREVDGIPADFPRIIVPSSREAMALIADAFYEHPSGELALVGVTGTNGKTTTTFLIDAILGAAGRVTGQMGTIQYRVGSQVIENPRTTSEAPDLQFYLSQMLEAGASHAVMEVSSHALDLGRVLGCEFKAAVFTNLTQDHLDFHGDMERYFQAKLRLFTEMAPENSILNLDDPWGWKIADEAAIRGAVIGYGMNEKADVRAEGLSISAEGMRFDLVAPEGNVPVESALTGQHNVSNILAAAAACLALGLTPAEVAQGIRELKSVPGRFEKVDLGQPFLVVVDYAHTEDALARILEFARPVTRGRVLTLMGCGGDRDKSKRPRMAIAALEGSDRVYMTSDNPRTEAPEAILKEVEAGADQVEGGRARSCTIVDRREAIQSILAEARSGDTVVIAGKGHETYQEIGTRRYPFDDRQEAKKSLQSLGYGN
jgi:UDP-N-acetylmuramoyl-L-alanyl-D-glutamate--2,6-diaminopimelate ligase